MTRDRTYFHMIDVGQGSCCVWASPSTDIVIDAHLPSSGTHVRSYLIHTAHVTSPVSLLLITGWDRDHAHPSGVGMVTRNFSLNEAWIPRWRNDTDCADEVHELLRTARWTDGRNVYYPSTDSRRAFVRGDTRITVFSPHPDDADTSNNCSIVAKLESDDLSVLITGDCERPRWTNIVRYFGSSLRADVLVAAHHGADNGLHEGALDLIRPKMVLISAGDTAHPNHPHPAALRHYRRAVGRDAVKVTRDHGSIRVWRDSIGRVHHATER